LNRKIIIIIICSFLYIFFIGNVSYAKYYLEIESNIIKIQNADNEFPFINGRNYNIDYETFNSDVNIHYEDNLGIKSARYWFNQTDKIFEGEGNDFINDTLFKMSGWYKVIVEDKYNHETIYIFLIDKELNSADIFCNEINDTGAILKFSASDYVIGIKNIDFYIKDKLYKTYTYNDEFIKYKEETLFVPIKELPFYENSYIVVKDFFDNELKSNIIFPNTSRIYSITDLIKLRVMTNTGESNFLNQNIYLVNNIDLSIRYSESKESWPPIGVYQEFSGNFIGNNFTISNLYINNNSDNMGLFGKIAQNSNISNLIINGKIYSNGTNIGGIVGNNNHGEIDNCYSDIIIFGNGTNVGGITRI